MYLPAQGSPRAGRYLCPPPGRKNIIATRCFQEFPGESIPMPNSPATVAPLRAVLPNCSLPAAPRAPPVPPSATLPHLLWKTLPAFPWDFIILPKLCHPRESGTVPSPHGAAAGGFPLSRSLSFTFPGHAAPPGAGSLPPRLHRFPRSPAHGTARREMLGRCFQPAQPTGRRPASRGQGGASTAMFSPTAGGQRAGKVALSLPTSLSSAATELISAWHLERQSCPHRGHPVSLCYYFGYLCHNFFPTKRLRKSKNCCPACRSPRWPWGRAAGCWLCRRPQARAKLRPLPQKQGRPSLLLPTAGAHVGWGTPRDSHHTEGCTAPRYRCHPCGLPTLNIKSSVLRVYMIYIQFTQRRADIQHIFSILYKDISETCWQGLTDPCPSICPALPSALCL